MQQPQATERGCCGGHTQPAAFVVSLSKHRLRQTEREGAVERHLEKNSFVVLLTLISRQNDKQRPLYDVPR